MQSTLLPTSKHEVFVQVFQHADVRVPTGAFETPQLCYSFEAHGMTERKRQFFRQYSDDQNWILIVSVN